MQTINERLTALPRLLNYDSAAALAKAVGLDPNSLRKAMQGPSKPGFDILQGVLSRHDHLSPTWLMLGKGEPLATSAPTTILPLAPAYGCIAPDLVTTLTAEVTELRAENKQLKDELRQARKEAREDLITQARTYNSVKEGDAQLIKNLYAHINRQNVKIDEYELRLGYRRPTAEERQQQEQSGDCAPRMEILPFGGRYRTPGPVEATECVVREMYPAAEVSLCEAA